MREEHRCKRCGGNMLATYDHEDLRKPVSECLQCGWTPPPAVIYTTLLKGDSGYRLLESQVEKITRDFINPVKLKTNKGAL